MSTIQPASTLIATRAILLIFALSSVVCTLHANEDGGKEKLSRLFQSHERLNIRLEGPFKKLLKKRGKERPYFEAALIYTDDTGSDVRVDMKIRVRGKSRAKRENCRFPPLKLNFNKKTLADTIFDGEDKLKLVTHCRASSRYEQFVLLEYVNYRVQNLLTEYSLRARLVTVEYYDTDSQKVTDTQTGFFIEDKDRMAARVGAKRLKVNYIGKEYYDQDLLHRATVFAYMLGTTDYSVAKGPPGDNCCHNIIPLQIGDGPVIPVPYDFDATGIVNPPYVVPSERFKLRSIRQRLYRGYCQDIEGFKKSFEIFHQHRDAIFSLYNNQEGLTSKTLKKTQSYLEQFYESISNEDKINKVFVKKCRS